MRRARRQTESTKSYDLISGHPFYYSTGKSSPNENKNSFITAVNRNANKLNDLNVKYLAPSGFPQVDSFRRFENQKLQLHKDKWKQEKRFQLKGK